MPDDPKRSFAEFLIAVSARCKEILREKVGNSRTNNRDDAEFISKYIVFRKYIEHEDTLINHRITWMLAIHGFLYATYGFTLQKLLEINEKISFVIYNNSTSGGQVVHPVACYLGQSLIWSLITAYLFLLCICLVGFFISLSALFSISGAYKAVGAVTDIFDYSAVPKALDIAYSRPRLFRKSRSLLIYQPCHLPRLTAGGLRGGEKRGFFAAWVIPLILITSWIISVVTVGFDVYNASENFEIGRPCLNLSNNTK